MTDPDILKSSLVPWPTELPAYSEGDGPSDEEPVSYDYAKLHDPEVGAIPPLSQEAGEARRKRIDQGAMDRSKGVEPPTLRALEGVPDARDLNGAEPGDVSMANIEALEAAEILESEHEDAAAYKSKSKDEISAPARQATRDRLIELVEGSGALLFSDGLGHHYAQVDVDGRQEVIELATAGAGHWLTDIFMEQENGKAPNREAIKEALDVMNARARRGPSLSVHTRLGPLSDRDGFALDLGDDQWRAVVVRAGSWSIEPHPVMFRRGAKSAAIPVPVRGGDLSLLRTVLNLTDDRSYRLIVGFLLGALNPTQRGYSGLMLTGGPGSAKTTGARLIRRIIDPTARMAETSSMPKRQDAFATTARAAWVPAFDNVSALTAEQSDWLAQLATGLSTSDRKKYSDADEFVIEACRPFIINGIDTADRGDLLSRVSTVEMPLIKSYSTMDALYSTFDAEWPRILGGLLDVAAAAVAELPNLPADGWEVRGADHVRWVTAGEAALGWEPRSYEAMIWGENQGAQQHALEALQWSGPLSTFLDRRSGTWTGTMTELLAELKDVASDDGDRPDSFGWPRSGKGMGDAVRRSEAGLAAIGITYVLTDRSHRLGRRWTWISGGVGGGDDGNSEDVGDV